MWNCATTAAAAAATAFAVAVIDATELIHERIVCI